MKDFEEYYMEMPPILGGWVNSGVSPDPEKPKKKGKKKVPMGFYLEKKGGKRNGKKERGEP